METESVTEELRYILTVNGRSGKTNEEYREPDIVSCLKKRRLR